MLRYAAQNPALHAAEQTRLDGARTFLGQLIDYWTPHYTTVALGGETGGYFWYSDLAVDAKAVHNTSALIAMASAIYGDLVADSAYVDRAEACARLLKARWSTTAAGGYTWNYCDDGLAPGSRRPEDVSHALVTAQFIRFAGARGWYDATDMARTSDTFTKQVWSGHPARHHGFVDGSDGGTSEWSWTRASTVGMAVQGDAPQGRPELFDMTRSVLMSSYLTRYGRPLTGGTTATAQTLALARLFQHRPAAFADDSAHVVVAGPNDTQAQAEGVRFYTVDWQDPADQSLDGLTLMARTASAANANVVVDVMDGETRPIIVSITYSATADGLIQQWDGAQYITLGDLPRSAADDDTVRWMRTTVQLDPSLFDYQGTAGTNVLLQFTSTPSVHRLEMTPL